MNLTPKCVERPTQSRLLEREQLSVELRLQTPENIDPKETVADVPWAVHEIPHVGSSNPIIARLIIQTWRALNNKLLKNDIKRLSHSLSKGRARRPYRADRSYSPAATELWTALRHLVGTVDTFQHRIHLLL
jgi:hypothetical protein